MNRRAVWTMAMVTGLLVVASGCGPDVTFDERARDLIETWDPDAGSSGALDVGGSDDVEAPLETLDHTAWDAIVGHFRQGGCVDYLGLLDSPEALGVLSRYLDQLRRADLEASWTSQERVAFWINAYNASVTAGVVQAFESSESFRVDQSDFAFFAERRFVVGGLVVSLDQIEHGALRGDAGHASLAGLDAEVRDRLLGEAEKVGGFDPRVHFAVNCASRSCPDLRAEAYRGESLDAQLEAQARDFLDDPSRGAGADGISALFTWFQGDFEAVEPIDAFIGRHRTGGLAGVDTGATLPYDWALNNVAADHPQCR